MHAHIQRANLGTDYDSDLPVYWITLCIIYQIPTWDMYGTIKCELRYKRTDVVLKINRVGYAIVTHTPRTSR